ncbi:MAG TPA: tRNA pseudouridine(55) synthase TruB [Chitinophagales bacterium]|nr:tRNA pseudouridine(55) synthase TruB [Chitinophagales bacterium]
MTDYTEGKILLIDKPLDWTSFDVVNKLKYTLKRRFPKLKIGHAGTLDPKASGLLIVCTGKFTKRITEIQDQYKVYTGSFFLGATTECFDTEKPVNQTFDISGITETDILQNVEQFRGVITQTPPIHSAVKVDGRAAYHSAREGVEVKLRSREVTIYEFDITKIELPQIYFRIKCSKGTYIRTIANDFGLSLNNGAYLSSLRREAIGQYSVEDAWQLEDFIQHLQQESNPENAGL